MEWQTTGRNVRPPASNENPEEGRIRMPNYITRAQSDCFALSTNYWFGFFDAVTVSYSIYLDIRISKNPESNNETNNLKNNDDDDYYYFSAADALNSRQVS